MRIAGLDLQLAKKVTNIKDGTYNGWTMQPVFQEVYKRVDEFNSEYKNEAIALLRRDNQLAAVMLEGKILSKLSEEMDTGKYVLAKTSLAREVYSKLIADIDYQPKAVSMSWEQRLMTIQSLPLEQPSLEEAVDGEVISEE